jgi:hypothetical protein
LSKKEIAARLFVSPRTISANLYRVGVPADGHHLAVRARDALDK